MHSLTKSLPSALKPGIKMNTISEFMSFSELKRTRAMLEACIELR